MRSYQRNSPQAAARIVALVLISDGHVSPSEYDEMKKLFAVRDLGIEPHHMPVIVQTLCEDLLMEGFDGRALLTQVGDGSMASLMAEVDDPQLQGLVLRIAASVVRADNHVSEGETAMLEAISRYWKTPLPPATAAGSSPIRHVFATADST